MIVRRIVFTHEAERVRAPLHDKQTEVGVVEEACGVGEKCSSRLGSLQVLAFRRKSLLLA